MAEDYYFVKTCPYLSRPFITNNEGEGFLYEITCLQDKCMKFEDGKCTRK